MTNIVLIAALAVTGAAPCLADMIAVQSKLQFALAETDEGRLKLTEFTASSASDIKDASRAQVESLLPIAQKCLGSPLKTVREYGLRAFSLVTFRPDSSELIAPYVNAIAPFLNQPDLAVKREAIMIFGTTQPRLLAPALDLLSAHLADKNNTEMEAGMIAASLVHGRPTDAGTIHDVLAFVSSHPGLDLRADMIKLLGLNNVTVDDAVKYIRGGLADQNPEVRRISVEAVGHMAPESRAKFSGDLLQLLANPNEPEDVRADARRVLQQ